MSSTTNDSTRCCIVGAGPGGLMLALLLVRAGIPTTVIEMHQDFDRDFRGDTIHPSTMEVLDQVGLADRLLSLPHTKAPSFRIMSSGRSREVAVYRRLPTRFPYMTVMPQVQFLRFLADEATRYAHFRLVMGASVHRLLEQQARVVGVSYRHRTGESELRATLTVGADGRFSAVRKLRGFEAVSQSEAMEVLWFRLPRKADDCEHEWALRQENGQIVILLGRVSEWQIGCVMRKGGYQQLKTKGIKALSASVGRAVPWLSERLDAIENWQHVNVLSVEASRVVRWHKPGLLLIGDAAHVMLPIAGVGINCAVADAVEAANVLVKPLRAGEVYDRHLARIQRRREWVTRIVQGFQAVLQRRALQADADATTFVPPLPIRIMERLPGVRDLPARITAFGVRRVDVQHTKELPVV